MFLVSIFNQPKSQPVVRCELKFQPTYIVKVNVIVKVERQLSLRLRDGFCLITILPRGDIEGARGGQKVAETPYDASATQILLHLQYPHGREDAFITYF